MQTANDSLTIHKLSAVVNAPKSTPHRALDGILTSIRTDLTRCLENTDLPIAGVREGGVWVVRKLRLDFKVASHWDGDLCARLLASALTKGMNEYFTLGSDQDDVVWFPSRTAYLAEYLLAQARGSAPTDWRFSSFKAFCSLGTSEAIVAALADDSFGGLQALGCLSALDRRAIYDALGSAGVRDVVARMAQQPSSVSDDSLAVDKLLTAIQGLSPAMGPVQAALEALVQALPDDGDEPLMGRMAELAAPLIKWHAAVSSLPAEQSRILLAALREGDLPALARADSSLVADAMPLLSLERPVRQSIVKAFQATGSDEAAAEATTWGYAGFYYLLPICDDYDFDLCFGDWPSCSDSTAPSVMRLLALTAAVGRVPLERAVSDQVLLEALGCSQRIDPSDVLSWAAQITLRQAQSAKSAWLDQNRRLGRVTSHNLESSHFEGSSTEAIVVRDPLTMFWITLSEEAEAPADMDFLGLEAKRVADASNSDYESVTLKGLAPIPRHLVALLAQNLLRSFARRLPGFANSTLGHLQTQTLTGSAKIKSSPESRDVECDPPPLSVLLNLAGVSRAEFTLKTTGGTSWKVRQTS